MSELVQTLKAEHANIVRILMKVSELGIESSEGKKALMSAKTGLLAHLQREDDHLYPVLLKAADDDEIIRDALEFFEHDIAEVSRLALDFFAKYTDELAGDDVIAEFVEDFGTLAGLLSQRIQKEEAIIYKMYDQLEA